MSAQYTDCWASSITSCGPPHSCMDSKRKPRFAEPGRAQALKPREERPPAAAYPSCRPRLDPPPVRETDLARKTRSSQRMKVAPSKGGGSRIVAAVIAVKFDKLYDAVAVYVIESAAGEDMSRKLV